MQQVMIGYQFQQLILTDAIITLLSTEVLNPIIRAYPIGSVYQYVTKTGGSLIRVPDEGGTGILKLTRLSINNSR